MIDFEISVGASSHLRLIDKQTPSSLFTTRVVKAEPRPVVTRTSYKVYEPLPFSVDEDGEDGQLYCTWFLGRVHLPCHPKIFPLPLITSNL
jgi:hypothetical protein